MTPLAVAITLAWVVIAFMIGPMLRTLGELLRSPDDITADRPHREPMVKHPYRQDVWVRLPDLTRDKETQG